MFKITPLQAQIATEVLEGTKSRRYGPIVWCKFCSRRHPRRKHDLVLEERTAKSGRMVMRWVHPKPKFRSQPKTKARRS